MYTARAERIKKETGWTQHPTQLLISPTFYVSKMITSANCRENLQNQEEMFLFSFLGYSQNKREASFLGFLEKRLLEF